MSRNSITPSRAFLTTGSADQALDRPGCRVAKRADGVAFDLLGHIEQHVDLALLAGVAFHHAVHHRHHPAGAFAARRALAAAFVLVEVADSRQIALMISVDLSITITAAVPRPDLRSRRLSKSIGVSMMSAPGTQGTEEPPGITASRLSQPPRMPPQWVSISSSERDRHRLFDGAGRVHVAGDAEQLGAGVVGPAEAREPGTATAQDRRRNRDRFHVVDRRRAAIKPALAGNGGFSRGWPFLPSRLSSSAVSSPQI
jgi:hypothetical protein